MSKSAKQVVIILVLLLVVSIVFALSTFKEKATLADNNSQLQGEVTGYKKNLAAAGEKQKELASENDQLKQQASEVLDKKTKLEEELTQLNTKIADFEVRIETLNSERDDWKGRYEKASKERDEAIAKMEDAAKKLEEQKKLAASQAAENSYAELDPSKQSENHWSGVLQEKAQLNLRIEKLEGDLNQSAMDIEELKKRNSDLEMEINSLKQEKDELVRQMTLKTNVADNISVDLVREKNDKKAVIDQLEKMKQENLDLRSQVKELGTMKIALEKSITRLQEDKAVIEKKLIQSETVIQSRLDDVIKLKDDIRKASSAKPKEQEVMLPPIIVNGSSSQAKPEAPAAPQAPQPSAQRTISGKVVSVNQENNFVILDLGEKSGAKIGDRLSVYRDDGYIGELEIIQVRSDISAADIRKQSMPLQPGDSVK